MSDRYFPDATAQQLKDAARLCRFAARAGIDDEWDHAYSVDARRATAELGWSWDFTTWGHAAGILEHEAALAEEDERATSTPRR